MQYHWLPRAEHEGEERDKGDAEVSRFLPDSGRKEVVEIVELGWGDSEPLCGRCQGQLGEGSWGRGDRMVCVSDPHNRCLTSLG